MLFTFKMHLYNVVCMRELYSINSTVNFNYKLIMIIILNITFITVLEK